MGNWLKILKELEPISQSQRLHEKLYNMLRRAEDFTPDKEDEFSEDKELLGKILIAFKDFQQHPPYMHESYGDMFGRYLEETEQLNDRAGQFFTPMSVVKMMAKMMHSVSSEEVQYISDPAAGCGRFMLGIAEMFQQEIGSYNFLMHNVDIDKRMYTYCTMNAILYAIPSVNIWGDSIANKYWEGFLVLQLPGYPVQWFYLDEEAVQKYKVEFERKKQGLEHFIEGDVPIMQSSTTMRSSVGVIKPKQKKLFSG